MAHVDYAALAPMILRHVGGAENISSATHCITRLRLFLKDNAAIDKKAIEQLDGVITTVTTGGQFQVVIGGNVTTVYEAFIKLLPQQDTKNGQETAAQKQNLLNQFIQLISTIFLPVVWTLAGAGLFKAFVVLAVTLGILEETSQTFIILDAAADSVLYFLPVLLAITTAKRFEVNQFVLVAIAGALLYPTIIELNDAETPYTSWAYPW